MNTDKIITIFCKPKTINKYTYIINDNDPHIIKVEDLFKFLSKFDIKNLVQQIHELINSYQSFIIYPHDKKIDVLEVDPNTHLTNIKKNIRKSMTVENIIKSDMKNKKVDKYKKYKNLNINPIFNKFKLKF